MLAMNIVLSMLCAGVVLVAAPILLVGALDVAADLFEDLWGDK